MTADLQTIAGRSTSDLNDGSPVTRVSTCLARIAATNDTIRAMIFVDADAALREAHRLEAELAAGRSRSRTSSMSAAAYDYDILDNAALRRLVPEIGSDVPGASYSRYDGQANPLRLLQAFHRAYQKLGGRALANSGVLDITRRGEKFVLKTARGEVVAGRIALAAGLGNAGLGDMLGVKIPLVPVRGQVLVTERVPMKLDYAIEQVRGTGDGTLMIGGSWEEVGYDLETTFDVTTQIAADSMFFFPFLENVRVVRSWSALRIITPDAAPAYEEVVPGAFLITCHSGVSLAALHAYESAGWLEEGRIPDEMEPFSLARFSDQT